MTPVGRMLTLSVLLGGLGTPLPASALPRDLDVVICIDASAEMRTHIEALRSSAPRLLEWMFAGEGAVRVGLVAYGMREGVASVAIVPFTDKRSAIQDALATFAVDGDQRGSAPVHRAILAALTGPDIGAWRPDASKVVVVVGRLRPAPEDPSLDDVVSASRQVGAARIFGLPVAGAGTFVTLAFSDLAHRTGGFVIPMPSPAELANGLMHMVSYGLSVGAPHADPDGVVTDVMGGEFEVERPAGVGPGTDVLVFSRDTPGVVIAIGSVTAVAGGKCVVDTRLGYTSEPVRVGNQVRWLRE